MQKIDIKSMYISELETLFEAWNEPKFRARQLFTWLHSGVSSASEMTNLPIKLRERIDAETLLFAPRIVRKQESRLDGTIKYLWEFYDGNCVESVLMRYKHGNTVCISTQVGCAMGCAFCASSIAGKARNLTPGEMLDQVFCTALNSQAKISNIVLMGIGEPLDNTDNVLKFLDLVNTACKGGMSVGMRHISLSTCGIVPEILRLAELSLQLTLSVSLHAPDDETRSKIMPINRRFGTDALFKACHKYFKATGRRISFEYALIDGLNDSDRQAELTAAKLRGMPAHVNLIRLNRVSERKLRPSRRVAQFQKCLEENGVTATVRRSLGSDIDAACGQLRRSVLAAQS